MVAPIPRPGGPGMPADPPAGPGPTVDLPDVVPAGAPEAGVAEFDRMVQAALPSVVTATLAAEPARMYRAVMARIERPLLRHALDVSGGNQLRAARLLGINRNTLRKRLRQLGLLPVSAAPTEAPR